MGTWKIILAFSKMTEIGITINWDMALDYKIFLEKESYFMENQTKFI